MTAPLPAQGLTGELIGGLLDAAGDDACWPQLCRDIARCLEAAGATLTLYRDGAPGQLLGGTALPSAITDCP